MIGFLFVFTPAMGEKGCVPTVAATATVSIDGAPSLGGAMQVVVGLRSMALHKVALHSHPSRGRCGAPSFVVSSMQGCAW